MSSTMRPTYKKVTDVLELVRRFHKQLADFYAGLSETSDKERVQMLLDYMSRHERNFEQAFAEYSNEVGRKLLDTWIQYIPDPDMLSVPEMKDLDGNMTVDDVADILMVLDDRLVRFYSEAARRAESVELKEFFGRLKKYEEAEKSKIAENAVNIKRGM